MYQVEWGPRGSHQGREERRGCRIVLIIRDKTRGKENTYTWVSVWWETKPKTEGLKLKRRGLRVWGVTSEFCFSSQETSPDPSSSGSESWHFVFSENTKTRSPAGPRSPVSVCGHFETTPDRFFLEQVHYHLRCHTSIHQFRRGRQSLPGCVRRTHPPVYMRARGGRRGSLSSQFLGGSDNCFPTMYTGTGPVFQLLFIMKRWSELVVYYETIKRKLI